MRVSFIKNKAGKEKTPDDPEGKWDLDGRAMADLIAAVTNTTPREDRLPKRERNLLMLGRILYLKKLKDLSDIEAVLRYQFEISERDLRKHFGRKVDHEYFEANYGCLSIKTIQLKLNGQFEVTPGLTEDDYGAVALAVLEKIKTDPSYLDKILDLINEEVIGLIELDQKIESIDWSQSGEVKQVVNGARSPSDYFYVVHKLVRIKQILAEEQSKSDLLGQLVNAFYNKISGVL